MSSIFSNVTAIVIDCMISVTSWIIIRLVCGNKSNSQTIQTITIWTIIQRVRFIILTWADKWQQPMCPIQISKSAAFYLLYLCQVESLKPIHTYRYFLATVYRSIPSHLFHAVSIHIFAFTTFQFYNISIKQKVCLMKQITKCCFSRNAKQSNVEQYLSANYFTLFFISIDEMSTLISTW